MSTAEGPPRRRRLRARWWVLCVLSVLAVYGWLWWSVRPVDRGLAKAVVREDWGQVARRLDGVSRERGHPVLRLLKAHACLALNRNNESLGLFAVTAAPADLQAWDHWTRRFAALHPWRPAAAYLRADALARRQQLLPALAMLNRALQRRPQHALSLAERGVIHAALGDWNRALLDLHAATSADPYLADAWASQGALCIQRHESPEAGAEAYSKALELNPDFALARLGRGALDIEQVRTMNTLVAPQRAALLEQAHNDLLEAARLGPSCPEVLGPIGGRNGQTAINYFDTLLADIYGCEPGTVVHTALTGTVPQGKLTKDQAMAAAIGLKAHSDLANATAGLIDLGRPSLQARLTVKGGTVGPVPYFGAKVEVGASLTPSSASLRQTATTANHRLGQLQRDNPDLGSGNPIKALGGITGRNLRQARVETGAWQALTAYGLLLPNQAATAAGGS